MLCKGKHVTSANQNDVFSLWASFCSMLTRRQNCVLTLPSKEGFKQQQKKKNTNSTGIEEKIVWMKSTTGKVGKITMKSNENNWEERKKKRKIYPWNICRKKISVNMNCLSPANWYLAKTSLFLSFRLLEKLQEPRNSLT